MTDGDELCVPLVDVGRSPSVLVSVLLRRSGERVRSVVLAVLEHLQDGRSRESSRQLRAQARIKSARNEATDLLEHVGSHVGERDGLLGRVSNICEGRERRRHRRDELERGAKR